VKHFWGDMENKTWVQHIEFMILMITMIGGVYMIDGKIDRQSERTDKLYTMFIDLVRATK